MQKNTPEGTWCLRNLGQLTSHLAYVNEVSTSVNFELPFTVYELILI